MPEKTRNKATAGLRKLIPCAGVIEGIVIPLEKRKVYVHAAARLTNDGLRHEIACTPSLIATSFTTRTKRHDVVRHGERISVTKVDLILTWSRLMMAELN